MSFLLMMFALVATDSSAILGIMTKATGLSYLH